MRASGAVKFSNATLVVIRRNSVSIKEFKIKIGQDGSVEEVTTKTDDAAPGTVGAGEKVLYLIIGVPVGIWFLLHWLFR